MENPILMQEHEGLQDLVQETLSLCWWESRSLLFHEFFEIELKVLENQVELFLTEQNLFQLNYVRMLKVLEEGDFSDGSRWDTIVLFLKPDLLNCYEFSSLLVQSFINDTVRSLSQLFKFLVLVQL